MKKILFLIIVFIATIQPAFACDLCAIYRSMEAKGANPGFNLGVFQQFTHFGTIREDGKNVGNPLGQKLDSSITQFIAGYQVNDRFGMQLSVPYISRSFKRPAYDDAGTLSIDKGTESGLGDLSLIGHYRAYQHLAEETIFAWDLIGGIKFPTGSTARIREELSEMDTPAGSPASGIHGHDLALGSGSYDGIVGTAIFGRWQRLYLTSGLQYSIRTRGDFDYQYANDLSWYVKPGGYLWLAHEGTLGLQLAVSGEAKGKDNMAGVTADDTGITSVFIGPELNFTWKENLSAELGAEFPVVANNTALQLVPDYRIKAAVTWRF
ncbi:MAG TPA: hypothetical protein VN642_01055 [Dongiaceae bacterium]|nr:hypothetical protein [Dongiaceae bacterium]